MHMIRAHDGKSKVQRRLVLGAWRLALLALFGLVVMVLWNWLMPALFDLPGVSYWQALGLLVLSRVLVGGLRGGSRGRGGHLRRERVQEQTREEPPPSD